MPNNIKTWNRSKKESQWPNRVFQKGEFGINDGWKTWQIFDRRFFFHFLGWNADWGRRWTLIEQCQLGPLSVSSTSAYATFKLTYFYANKPKTNHLITVHSYILIYKDSLNYYTAYMLGVCKICVAWNISLMDETKQYKIS